MKEILQNIKTGTMSHQTVNDIRKKLYLPDQYNNDQVFLNMIEAVIKPGSIILDFGAGAGLKFKHDLKSSVAPDGEVVGADYDDRVLKNTLLHRGIVLDGPELPFEDESFDVIFSRYVLEHIQNPRAFIGQINRILKLGGHFLFLTPNKWHYVSVISRLTPHPFHAWYNKRRKRDEEDTFPTVYRLNSRSAVRRICKSIGLKEHQLVMRECCPNYLMLSKPLFMIGVLYERFVNSSKVFAGFRVNILGHFTKVM